MRKDELRRLNDRSNRRDLFSDQRHRRRIPWIGILILVAVAAGALLLSRTDLGALLDSVQHLLPESSDVPTEVTKGDPDSLPLPPPPPGG